jgi:hypothetical protein
MTAPQGQNGNRRRRDTVHKIGGAGPRPPNFDSLITASLIFDSKIEVNTN